MNTNHLSAVELYELQADAKLAFDALPPVKRERFYDIAQRGYLSSWSSFGAGAKAMCALLAYISELPEPPLRRN